MTDLPTNLPINLPANLLVNLPVESSTNPPINLAIDPPIGRTPRHESLLTIPIKIAGIFVNAVVDCRASAPIIGPKIAKRLGVWKRRKKIKIQQGDGSNIKGGKYVINTQISIKTREASELRPFALDAEVADIGSRDAIIGLSWLVDNDISIDTPKRLLKHPDFTIQCRHHLIPIVSLLEETHVDDASDILLIIDVNEKYAAYL